jgi:LPXTG-motif cell wall-anchored protein
MSTLLAEYWWAIVGAFAVGAAFLFLRRRGQAHG